MKNIFLGNLIRERREILNISQETLCTGICNTMTLSRLENGQQLPPRHKIIALMERLGLPSDRYFAILSKNDEAISILQTEINSLVVQAERETGDASSKKIKNARQKIKELKKITHKNDTVIKQFIMSEELTLKELEKTISLDEQLNIAIQTLKITIPQINLLNIANFLLNLNEITLLNQIAIIYSRKDAHNEALRIYSQLFDYTQKHFKFIEKAKSKQALIAYNYALELDLTENYNHAISIAEQGIHICTKHEHYQFLPGFYHIQAESWHYLGNGKKSQDLFYQAYYLYKATKNITDINLLKKDASKWFHLY